MLGYSNMVSTILFLQEHGASRKKTIYDAVARGRMGDKLDRLRDIGLVDFDEDDMHPVIRLTDLGEDVAGHLRAIDDALRASQSSK